MFNAVEYINTPRWQNVSLGLDRTRLLLELLGNPQNSLKFVHVAGTNGKGSTCAFLESIFRTAGLKTGLFTSPYLMCFEDRIRVNNANISQQALTEITLKVKDAAEKVEAELGEHPTEFELMTAVAFCHFACEKCDIVVCEVGLGGRLDSTNVITPEVSVITHIGLDHMAILGDSLEEIAAEKAGIIKQNVPVVLAPQEDSVYPIVEEVASNLNAPLVALRKTAGKPSQLLPSLFLLSESKAKGSGRSAFSANNTRYALPKFAFENTPAALDERKSTNPYSLIPNPLQPLFSSFNNLNMQGSYQQENACVAASVAQLMGVDEADIKAGLKNATWPGRFEVFEGDGPSVIVDGAHNVDGARVLRESLCNLNVGPSTSLRSSQDDVGGNIGLSTSQDDVEGDGPCKRIAVFGALKDKDVEGIVDEVGELFDHFFVYKVDSPRAMDVDELAPLTQKFAETDAAESAEAALAKALEFAKKEGHQNLVVCFGSLYSIGDIRRYLLKRR